MNNFKIDSIKIDGLFNSSTLMWNLDKVNVLVGKNGTGKSTVINIINSLLTGIPNEYIDRSTGCTIEFAEGNSITLEIDSSGHSISVSELKIILDRIINNSSGKNIDPSEIVELLEQINETNSIEDADEVKISSSKYVHRKISKEELNNNLNVEFISTINLNSNSISEIKSSSGVKTTILDFEIQNEIDRFLNKKSVDNICLDLEKVLNTFLKESEKTAVFDESNFKFLCKNGNELSFQDLSSGERQLFYILLRAANSRGKFTIFLMDEPEISLHLSWQEELINSILELNDNCQIIIVTHSPAIIMNGWLNSYMDIQEIIKDEK
ncbi:ATP-binding protein [Shewanella cyperi]|uniref:ATP-binding protein n=1 Tax=Shewanella cyperi TaxID=2814292 RepID=A0A974XM44_9GAMM|nr:ATP-binding protein [Shewanella cyperi]QSX29561.1 ATP-binding protein [Shewanella cyperi]